jgi:hypothetical protein
MCNLDIIHQIQQADLRSIVRDNCKHLSANHNKKLLQLLMKYDSLFHSTLGDWKNKPVSSQLEKENNILWPSFPRAKNTQGYHHQRS